MTARPDPVVDTLDLAEALAVAASDLKLQANNVHWGRPGDLPKHLTAAKAALARASEAVEEYEASK